MAKKLLKGLIAAPFTPMNADGSIRLDMIPAYADFLVAKQCVSGVFICGTSGESVSMTTDERKALADAWIKAAYGRMKVVVHVGGMSQPQCMELSAHAQTAGADAIAAMAPCFFKPSCVQDLIDFFKPVAAAASGIPFYYYNMPSITGVSLPVDRFLTEGKSEIPTLAGVKFTHNNLMEMMQCVNADGGRFDVLNGFDEILIAGLAAGVKGAVGSTYNYIPGIYQAVMDAMEKGDIQEARRMQYKAIKIVDVLIRHGGGVRGGKIFMKLAGFDCGPCRLPISTCSEEELEETRKELEKTDFFSYAVIEPLQKDDNQ
ncbi:dihydrodipicolinate synthase family protein [uncultured Duncaniella sp.]|jgi:Dihydrodipicolinate synthase/N-acetylneuraminate lyase|uniref:dihydrodipicolinate synthase family protein n=1 Tax=uncultured Duncaniella sp. TaxID=2768039 RepID=UPI0025B06B88|nr:dihydrodipicolinate synthase family protein [uncultured Duncaniella sp.]